MSIQYIEEFDLDNNLINLETEEKDEDIVSFNNIII